MASFTLTSGGWEFYESVLRKWGLRLKEGFTWDDQHYGKGGYVVRKLLPWSLGRSSRSQGSVHLTGTTVSILAASVAGAAAAGLAAWTLSHGSSTETLGKALASIASSACALQADTNSGSDEGAAADEDVLIAGLHNAGNSCFLNVILQALASSEVFATFVTNCVTTELESEPKLQSAIPCDDSPSHGRHGKTEESSMPLAAALAAVLEELSRPIVKQHVASPHRVIQALENYVGEFDMASQQDAAEALAHLAAALKEECNRRFIAIYPKLLSMARAISHGSYRTGKGTIRNVDGTTARIKRCNDQPETFLQAWRKASMWPMEGTFSSLIKCQHCGHQFTMQLQTFNEIVLSPPTIGSPSCVVGPCTVEDCLQRFTSPEQIMNVVCAKCSHRLTARTISPTAYWADQGLLMPHCGSATGSRIQDAVQRLKKCPSNDDCGCEKMVKQMGFEWRKQESMATKCLFVARAPEVLCLQIQRLAVNASGSVDKLRGHVEFPLVLDLLPYTLVFSCAEYVKEAEPIATSAYVQNAMGSRNPFIVGVTSAAARSAVYAAYEEMELTAVAPPFEVDIAASRRGKLHPVEPGIDPHHGQHINDSTAGRLEQEASCGGTHAAARQHTQVTTTPYEPTVLRSVDGSDIREAETLRENGVEGNNGEETNCVKINGVETSGSCVEEQSKQTLDSESSRTSELQRLQRFPCGESGIPGPSELSHAMAVNTVMQQRCSAEHQEENTLSDVNAAKHRCAGAVNELGLSLQHIVPNEVCEGSKGSGASVSSANGRLSSPELGGPKLVDDQREIVANPRPTESSIINGLQEECDRELSRESEANLQYYQILTVANSDRTDSAIRQSIQEAKASLQGNQNETLANPDATESGAVKDWGAGGGGQLSLECLLNLPDDPVKTGNNPNGTTRVIINDDLRVEDGTHLSPKSETANQGDKIAINSRPTGNLTGQNGMQVGQKSEVNYRDEQIGTPSKPDSTESVIANGLRTEGMSMAGHQSEDSEKTIFPAVIHDTRVVVTDADSRDNLYKGFQDVESHLQELSTATAADTADPFSDSDISVSTLRSKYGSAISDGTLHDEAHQPGRASYSEDNLRPLVLRGDDPYNEVVEDASSNCFVRKEYSGSQSRVILVEVDVVSGAQMMSSPPTPGSPQARTTLSAVLGHIDLADAAQCCDNGCTSAAVLHQNVMKQRMTPKPSGDGPYSYTLAPFVEAEERAANNGNVEDDRTENGAAYCGHNYSISFDSMDHSQSNGVDIPHSHIASPNGCNFDVAQLALDSSCLSGLGECGSRGTVPVSEGRLQNSDAVMCRQGRNSDGACLPDSNTNTEEDAEVAKHDCYKMEHLRLLVEESEKKMMGDSTDRQGEKAMAQKRPCTGMDLIDKKPLSTNASVQPDELEGDRDAGFSTHLHKIAQKSFITHREQHSSPNTCDSLARGMSTAEEDRWKASQSKESMPSQVSVAFDGSNYNPQELSTGLYDRLKLVAVEHSASSNKELRIASSLSAGNTSELPAFNRKQTNGDKPVSYEKASFDDRLELVVLEHSASSNKELQIASSSSAGNTSELPALNRKQTNGDKPVNDEKASFAAVLKSNDEGVEAADCSFSVPQPSASCQAHRRTMPSTFFPGLPLPYGLYRQSSSEVFSGLHRLPPSSEPTSKGGRQAKALWYELVSVVVHIGGSAGGHYIVYRKLALPRMTKRSSGVSLPEAAVEKASTPLDVDPSQNPARFTEHPKVPPSLNPVLQNAQEVSSPAANQAVFRSMSCNPAAEYDARQTRADTNADDFVQRTQDITEQLGVGGSGKPLRQHVRTPLRNGSYGIRKCLTGTERAWFCVSDSRVTRVSEVEVLRAEASLLFYQRISECIKQP